MIKKTVLLLLLTALLLVPALQAQTKNSVYSMFGIGQVIDDSYGINQSFGGAGIAFQSGRFINHANPASYLGVLPHSFIAELGAYGMLNRSESNQSNQHSAAVNINYFSMGLYLMDRWSASAGFVPYSYIDYEIHSQDEIGGELTTYKKVFKGTGGMSKVYLGNAVQLIKGVSVGANIAYIGGPITQTESAAASGSFSGYQLKTERSAYGLCFDYGLQASVPLREWVYSIGLTYAPAKSLTTDNERTFTYDNKTSKLEKDRTQDIRLPQRLGIGVALRHGSRWRAGADYELSKWSEIDFSNPVLSTRNSQRISAGMEFVPGAKGKGAGIFSWRLGGRYKSTYMEISDTPIDAMAVDLGMGIAINPVFNFNLTLEYGREGTLSSHLIRNNYLALYVNYSLHDFWRRRNYY